MNTIVAFRILNSITSRYWSEVGWSISDSEQRSMACLCSLDEEERAAALRSRSIDRQLDQDKEQWKREIKILLLGAGESGKSTFLKQMRIIHGENYSAEDRLEFRPIIYHNILKGMRMLIEIRRKLGISLSEPSNEDYCDIIIGYRSVSLGTEQFSLYRDALAALWADRGILEAYERRSKFQVVSSFSDIRCPLHWCPLYASWKCRWKWRVVFGNVVWCPWGQCVCVRLFFCGTWSCVARGACLVFVVPSSHPWVRLGRPTVFWGKCHL